MRQAELDKINFEEDIRRAIHNAKREIDTYVLEVQRQLSYSREELDRTASRLRQEFGCCLDGDKHGCVFR